MPNDLTANAQIILKRRLTALAEDAQADRTASNLSKALGLSSLVLGGLAAVSTGGLATIPLGIGLAAYLGGVMSQARKTGRTMLIPFSDAGLVEMLGGVAGAAVELPDLEDYAYMSTQQKAEYAMILTCGNRLATALAQLPGDQHRQFAYAIAKRRFFELYGSHIKNSPELLMAVDAAEVAEFILAGEEEFKQLRAKQASLPPAPALETEQPPAPEQRPPQPPAPTVGPATRLGAISVPAAPAAAPAEQQWDDDEIAPPATAVDILQECLGYPAILIYGPSGSGKSTLAKWLIQQRLAAGHHCEVLDPHAAYGAWGELPVYGGGMDYQGCDDRLVAFAELVKSRYQVLNSRPNFNPKPYTLLTEEFTNWASHCPHAGQFFAGSMSDLRKVNMFAVYVAHGRTLTSLGGKSGVAEQRDQSLLEIELSTSIGPGGMPIPSGKARIYYPGQKGSPITVDVPNLAELPIAAAAMQQRSHNLESTYSADSADETIALVREALIQSEEPLLASVIRQKKSRLKEGFSREQLEAKLKLMAMEGFIKSDDQEPPRYSLP